MAERKKEGNLFPSPALNPRRGNRWTEAAFRDEKERDWNRQVCHATTPRAHRFTPFIDGAIVYQSTRRETRGAHRAHQLLLMLLIWTRLKGARRVSLGTERSIFRSDGAPFETDQPLIQADLKNSSDRNFALDRWNSCWANGTILRKYKGEKNFWKKTKRIRW